MATQTAKCHRAHAIVRMATDQDHADDAGSIWDCCIDSNEEQILTPQLWIRVGIQNTIV